MPLIVYLLFLFGKLFALVVGYIYFKYLPRPYKLVLYLIAIASFCECYGYYLGKYLRQHNVWVFNLFMPIDFSLIGLTGIYMLKNKLLKRIFLFFLILNIIIWIINIAANTIYVFATISMIIGCAIMVMLYIILLLNNILFNSNVLKQPIFWLSLSSILFYGCDIPYMGMNVYLSTHMPAMALQLSKINFILDIIRYPLVAISFILLGRQKQVVIKAA